MPGILGFKDANLLRKMVSGKVRRFTYSIPVTSVAVSSSAQAAVQVESASCFFCNAITGRVWNDGATDTNRMVDFAVASPPRIEVIDQASGASLFDRSDVSFDSLWGPAIFPTRINPPHLFEPRTVITVVLTNISAAVAMRLQVSFHGYKEYLGAR